MLRRFFRCVFPWPYVLSQHYFKMDGIGDYAGRSVPNFVTTVAYVPELLTELGEQAKVVKRVFRVFIRVGAEGVDQWFVARG